jgi:hypothetical protein
MKIVSKACAMWKRRLYPYLAISVVLGSVMAASPALSQGGVDPIGKLKKTATFDRAQRVDVGKSSKGNVVCFTEDYDAGDAEFYVGMSADGAFIRAEFGRALPKVPLPKPPLRIFAGKGLTKLIDGDEKYTGEYAPLQGGAVIYSGAVDYVPLLDTIYGEGYVLVIKGDAKSFLETVARAREEFIVVQSISEPKDVDASAIYRFKASTISALLACAKKHIQ